MLPVYVNNPSVLQQTDGVNSGNLLVDHNGGLLVRQMSGRRYGAASRGNCYVGTTGAVTLPIFSSVAPTALIYNPVASTKLIELHKIRLTLLTATVVIDGFVIATPTFGADPTSVTAGTVNKMPLNGTVINPQGVVAKVATVTAPALLMGLGITFAATTAGATSVLGEVDFDGTMVLAPGVTIVVAPQATLETASDFIVDFVWSEWLA